MLLVNYDQIISTIGLISVEKRINNNILKLLPYFKTVVLYLYKVTIKIFQINMFIVKLKTFNEKMRYNADLLANGQEKIFSILRIVNKKQIIRKYKQHFRKDDHGLREIINTLY